MDRTRLGLGADTQEEQLAQRCGAGRTPFPGPAGDRPNKTNDNLAECRLTAACLKSTSTSAGPDVLELKHKYRRLYHNPITLTTINLQVSLIKMKFSLATIAAFASAVAAATLPSSFTLVADGGSTVVTDGRMSPLLI